MSRVAPKYGSIEKTCTALDAMRENELIPVVAKFVPSRYTVRTTALLAEKEVREILFLANATTEGTKPVQRLWGGGC